jgi:cold shock protein
LTIAKARPKIWFDCRAQDANVNTRDFRPRRRRGFDDDNYQTPSRNFGYAPPRGPQFDSPSGPPVSAVVKWYNPDKGFGFVTLADGSGDAFLHVSVVERAGQSSVPPGATIEVRAAPGPKGPQVTELLSVDTSTALQEQPRRPRPDRFAHASVDRSTVEALGTVRWYNAAKGFGFITPDQGGRDIFVHASALDRSGVLGLADEQRVAVDVAEGQKGPEAVKLRLI